MRLKLALAAVAIALLLPPASASAQWDPSATADLGAGYGRTALSQSILTNTRDPGSGGGGSEKPKKRKAKKPRKPTQRQLQTLRFAPDPAVTEANNARLADVLLATCPPEDTICPPNHAEIIAGLLPTGQFRASFARNLKALAGGSADNLADVAAGAVLLVWEAQRAEPGRQPGFTDAETAGAKRFLRGTRATLALNRRIRRMPDADQQEMAETLANVAQHGIALQAVYLGWDGSAPDTATAAIISTYLGDVVERWLGVDVDDLRLTRRGFVRR